MANPRSRATINSWDNARENPSRFDEVADDMIQEATSHKSLEMPTSTKRMVRTAAALAHFLAVTAAKVAANPSPKFLDDLAAKFQVEQGLPGLVVASVAQRKARNGIDCHLRYWAGAYGYANIGREEPMTTDTSLWFASVTKAVVGTILTKAVEDGHLTMESKVSDILREANSFQLGDPNATPWLEDITLQHLVTHRSTIVDDPSIYLCGYFVGDRDGDHMLLVDLFGQVDNVCVEDSPVVLGEYLEAYLASDGPYYSLNNFLSVQPGEQHEYSNVGAALTGHLISLATGTPLPEYSSSTVFSQLGMRNTSFRQSDLSRIATPYTTLNGVLEEYQEMPIYDVATFPDGGLRSSVNDMAKFLGMLMNDGTLAGKITTTAGADSSTTVAPRASSTTLEDVILLQPESVRKMFTPAYEGDSRGTFWFITSLEIGGKERNLIGHNGADPGAFSYMFFDPDSSTGYIIAGNGESDNLDPQALANLTAALFAHADAMLVDDDNGSGEDTSGTTVNGGDGSASTAATASVTHFLYALSPLVFWALAY